MMDCTNCNRQVDYPPVPFVVHENLRAQMDLHARRLVRVIVLLIVLLVGSNALWLWHDSQYAIERTITEIEQDTDGGGSNYVVGGNYNGEAEDQENDD